MTFRYKGFVILVRSTHGHVRAVVLHPSRPHHYQSFPAPDVERAVEAARQYVDRSCAKGAGGVQPGVSN